MLFGSIDSKDQRALAFIQSAGSTDLSEGVGSKELTNLEDIFCFVVLKF